MFGIQFNLGNTYEMTITPDMAKFMLENHNDSNRKVDPSKVKKFTEDMLSGQWNRDSVEGKHFKVDTNGQIVSAQHRLLAVLEAKIPLTVLIEIVDRDWDRDHTHEKRTGLEQASMMLKNRYNNKGTSAISAVAGQIPFLTTTEGRHTSFRPVSRPIQYLPRVNDKIGASVEHLSLLKGVSQKALSAACILIYIGYISMEEAEAILSDVEVKAFKGKALNQWVKLIKEYKDGVQLTFDISKIEYVYL